MRGYVQRDLYLVLMASLALGSCTQRSPLSAEEDTELPTPTVRALNTTYQVGPSRPTYHTLQDVAGILGPGDVVELDYSPTPYPPAVRFTRSGTAAAPITIRGIVDPSTGKRPVIKAGINQANQINTVHFNLSNYYRFENIEVDGSANQGNSYNSVGPTGTYRCIYNEANGITLRNVYMHDCPRHGLQAADSNSGSLTLEYSELTRAGSLDNWHVIYMDTDPVTFPNAVFRMQHCYVHDGNGGYLVKSRAERNEIYYNWLENAYYRELELIGRDQDGPPLRPMNSDVVGNVLNKLVAAAPTANNNVRIGHDWESTNMLAGSYGRYRFVNNSFVLPAGSTSASIVAWGKLESVEMHNNVYYRPGQAIEIFNDNNAHWTSGRVVAGQKNWVESGSTVPGEWTGTLSGSDPGFVSTTDRRLIDTSPLRDQGTSTPTAASGYAFPSPLFPPAYVPPVHMTTLTATSRPTSGTIDIGAYEWTGSGPPDDPPSCQTVGQGWTNTSITPQTGTFTAQFDVTPSSAPAVTDAVVGLTKDAVSAYSGLVANIRFNNSPSNHIDARNGAAYTGSVPFTPGTKYHFRLVVNVVGQTYTAYVTPNLGTEVVIGTNLAFRSAQSLLNNWAGSVDVASQGTLSVCNFAVTTGDPPNLLPDGAFETSLGGGGNTGKDYFLADFQVPGQLIERSTTNPIAGASSLHMLVANNNYAEAHDRTAADLTLSGTLTTKGTIRNNGTAPITVRLSAGYFDSGWVPRMTHTDYTLAAGSTTVVTQTASIPTGTKTQLAHWIKCTTSTPAVACNLSWDTAYIGFGTPP